MNRLVVAARLGNAELCWALMDSGLHPDEHGILKGSRLGQNSGAESEDLEDIAWNPVMVALHAEAYVTAVILLAYGADASFQVPEQKITRYNKYRLSSLGMTPLHVAIKGGRRNSRYNSHQFISLGSSGIDSCAFSVATHPDHSVEGVSRMRISARATTQRHAELKDIDDNAPSSDSEYEIEKFVYVNDSTKASETPFDTLFGTPFASKKPCDPLLEAIIQGESTASKRQEALIEYMLQNGASVNARTQGGITPLFIAVIRGHLGLIRLLLEHGADPNVAAVGGCSPLIVAAWNGQKEIINALATWGANVDAQLLIEHHAHGRLLTRREIRHHKRFLFGNYNSAESSDTDPEPDPQRWKGCYSVGTALTWARGDVRELLLRHGADPTKEVALRRCDCQVIKEREIKEHWLEGSDDE